MLYFDNAAAARPDDENIKYFASSLAEDFANQESAHGSGYRLRKKITEAGERLSAALTGSPDWHPVWSTSGTGALNLFAVCAGNRNIRAVTSKLEHPALTAAVKRLDPEFHRLEADPLTGKIRPEHGKWNLAAFHLVQSETGALQNPEELFDACPDAWHLLDAVQGACKIKLPLENTHILVISGNKFGAPGCAALLLNPRWKESGNFAAQAEYARNTSHLAERVLPSAILTCAFAAEKQQLLLEKNLKHIENLNRMIRESCPELGLEPTLPPEHASPYILHLRAPGFQGGVLVRMLSEEGILVSSGSACASESKDPSPALTALGYKKDDAYSGLRISFGFNTTEQEVKILLSSLKTVLKKY